MSRIQLCGRGRVNLIFVLVTPLWVSESSICHGVQRHASLIEVSCGTRGLVNSFNLPTSYMTTYAHSLSTDKHAPVCQKTAVKMGRARKISSKLVRILHQ